MGTSPCLSPMGRDSAQHQTRTSWARFLATWGKEGVADGASQGLGHPGASLVGGGLFGDLPRLPGTLSSFSSFSSSSVCASSRSGGSRKLCLLQCVDSIVVACGLSHPEAPGALVPRPGVTPVSPALQGGFLIIGPPGTSWKSGFVAPHPSLPFRQSCWATP